MPISSPISEAEVADTIEDFNDPAFVELGLIEAQLEAKYAARTEEGFYEDFSNKLVVIRRSYARLALAAMSFVSEGETLATPPSDQYGHYLSLNTLGVHFFSDFSGGTPRWSLNPSEPSEVRGFQLGALDIEVSLPMLCTVAEDVLS